VNVPLIGWSQPTPEPGQGFEPLPELSTPPLSLPELLVLPPLLPELPEESSITPEELAPELLDEAKPSEDDAS
jgi:hypothetical protein